ncbi:MAG: pyrroline-5-carboxylate reductase [Pseudomonadota bacterium]
MQEKIAFIGGGNMARAIVLGLINSGVAAARIVISEPAAERRRELARELPGVTVTSSNGDAAADADTLLLAVKPQVLRDVCRELEATVVERKPLVVSIAAGIGSADIEAWLGGALAVVRVMPNQPALLGLGVSGMVGNASATGEQLARAERIMAAAGKVVRVADEAQIDAVTAVSGSGPAYFFLLIDMLAKSGEKLGLDADTSLTLALETARGSAALALDANEDMAELINRVRSPGGTTAAALDILSASDVRGIFERALIAARDRAAELAAERT